MSEIVIGAGDNGQPIAFELAPLVETRLLIQSNSGGGKSYAIRRLLEQSHGAVQQLVLDVEGEFATLREHFDYIIAGRGGDTPAEPRSAKMLARKLMDLRVSAICDLSELPAHDRVRFVRFFLEALIAAPRDMWHPALVVVDEAHVFAPEKGQAESAQAVIDLATRGRKRGLCAILATQRLAKLHKDATAELLNKLIGRTGQDLDQRRAADELGIVGKEERLGLRDLEPGQFYAFGPAISKGVIRVNVGSVRSRHPKVGERGIIAPPPPTAAVRSVLAKLADLPAEAEQEAKDNAALQATIAGLRRELLAASKGQPTVAIEQFDELRRQVASVRQEGAEERRNLKAQVHTQEAQYGKLTRVLGRTVTDLEGIAGRLRGLLNGDVPAATETATRPLKSPVRPDSDIPRAIRSDRAEPTEYGGEEVSRPQQAILKAIRAFEPLMIMSLPKSVVAVYAGASPTSGGYFNNLGRLRAMGLVDYPKGGEVALTDAGRELAGSVEMIGSVGELHEAWYRMLPKPQAAILRELVRVYPDELSKDELAERVEASPTSGGYFNNLGRLRTLGAIIYPTGGRARAAQLMFPAGVPT